MWCIMTLSFDLVLLLTCTNVIAFLESSPSSDTMALPCSLRYTLIHSHIVFRPSGTRINNLYIQARSAKKGIALIKFYVIKTQNWMLWNNDFKIKITQTRLYKMRHNDPAINESREILNINYFICHHCKLYSVQMEKANQFYRSLLYTYHLFYCFWAYGQHQSFPSKKNKGINYCLNHLMTL